MEILAAVVERAGAVPTLRELELAPPEADEVRVRIHATGICHTDLAFAAGAFGTGFPAVPGHEIAGVVDAVGAAARDISLGDRVVVSVLAHCGRCTACVRGEPALCEQRDSARSRLSRRGQPVAQAFGTGGFAEATVVPASAVEPVPDAIPLRLAAVAGCALLTGFGAVTRIAQIGRGASVAVIGCGAVGLATLAVARVAGAEQIVAVDVSPRRREQALTFGATQALAPGEASSRASRPQLFDTVFEAAGSEEAALLALSLTRRGGDTVLMGLPPHGTRLPIDHLELVVGQKSIHGCNMGNARPRDDVAAIFDLHCRGLIDLGRFVTATFPLEQIADAFDHAHSAAGVRTVVVQSDG